MTTPSETVGKKVADSPLTEPVEKAPAAPAPTLRSADGATPAGAGAVDSWVSRNTHWLLVLIPYLFAWWQPLLWCWGWWGNPRTPVFLQGLVPLLSLAVAWAWRDEIGAAVKRAKEANYRNFWVRGNLIPLVIGCIGLFLSHLIYVKGIAIFSLWLIAVGIVYRAYGLPVVKAAWVPFTFALLTIPPPDGLLVGITGRILPALGTLTAAVFSLVTKTNVDPKGFVRFEDWRYSVEFREGMSPFAVLLPALTLALAYILYRRMNWRQGMPLLVATAGAATVASVLQAVVLVLLYKQSAALGDWMQFCAPIMPADLMSGEGIVKVLGAIIPAWANLLFSFGLALLVTRQSVDASKLARPTGAAANQLGNFVGLIFSPLVFLLNFLTNPAKYLRKKRNKGW